MPSYILPPSDLPEFLIAGHAFVDDSVYAPIERATGHARKRRVWTAAPRTYEVSWILGSAEMRSLDAWFEDVLLAGERHFIARVQIEDGLMYWEAMWVAPYLSEPFNAAAGLHWRITGRIVMFGDPTSEPQLSGLLEVEYALPLVAEVEVAGPSLLVAEYGLALETALPLTAEYGLELDEYEPFYLLIGGGSYLLVGGDSRLLIE